MGVEVGTDGEVGGGAERDGMAVGSGLRQAHEPDCAVRPGHVLDHYRLAERRVLREGAPQDIAAARGKRDDEPNRPCGVILRRELGTERGPSPPIAATIPTAMSSISRRRKRTRVRKFTPRSQAAAGPRTATSTNSRSARPTRNNARNSIAMCSSSNRCTANPARLLI